jgi:hypothetical protein
MPEQGKWGQKKKQKEAREEQGTSTSPYLSVFGIAVAIVIVV